MAEVEVLEEEKGRGTLPIQGTREEEYKAIDVLLAQGHSDS